MLMVHFCTPWKLQKTSGFLMFSVVREGNIGMKLVKISVSAKVKGYQMVQLQDSKNIQPSFRGTFRIHKKTFIFTKKLHYEWQDPKYASVNFHYMKIWHHKINKTSLKVMRLENLSLAWKITTFLNFVFWKEKFR